jgi:hypothetical protein
MCKVFGALVSGKARRYGSIIASPRLMCSMYACRPAKLSLGSKGRILAWNAIICSRFIFLPHPSLLR